MKKNLSAGIIALLAIAVGCSKDKKDSYCSPPITGSYKAITYKPGGEKDDEMNVMVAGNAANRNQVIFSEATAGGSDDRIYANMICGTSTLTFTNEGELDNLVSGTGSFDTVARTIQFRLITRPGSGPELDTLDYVLRRPD